MCGVSLILFIKIKIIKFDNSTINSKKNYYSVNHIGFTHYFKFGAIKNGTTTFTLSASHTNSKTNKRCFD